MYGSPFIDDSFDITDCHNYILSIQYSLDGFSFSLFSKDQQQFLYFDEYRFISSTAFELLGLIKKQIEQIPLLKNNFQEVHICFLTKHVTVIPSSLFLEQKVERYFDTVFERNRNNKVHFSTLNNELKAIYDIPSQLYSFFNTLYNNTKFHSPIDALISHASSHLSKKRKLIVYKNSHTLYLILIYESKVELVNTFFVKNDTDCLFYIMSTLHNKKHNTQTEITIYGKIKPKSELQTMLKKYFKEVSLAKFNTHYTVPYSFYKEPENYHLTTMELVLCE